MSLSSEPHKVQLQLPSVFVWKPHGNLRRVFPLLSSCGQIGGHSCIKGHSQPKSQNSGEKSVPPQERRWQCVGSCNPQLGRCFTFKRQQWKINETRTRIKEACCYPYFFIEEASSKRWQARSWLRGMKRQGMCIELLLHAQFSMAFSAGLSKHWANFPMLLSSWKASESPDSSQSVLPLLFLPTSDIPPSLKLVFPVLWLFTVLSLSH